MSKTKEAETQPYRNFKEFLDTIIKMPEDLKNRLANEFERRRLEVPVVEAPVVEAPVVKTPVVEDKPDEDKSFFGDMFSKNSSEDKPVVTEDKPEEKSFFADMFSKNSSENNPVVTKDKPEEKSFFADMFSKNSSENNPVVTENKPVVTENKDKSLFDSIFTNNQTNEMINKFSGTAPQKKCQIRPW
jgi:hypothetical protein